MSNVPSNDEKLQTGLSHEEAAASLIQYGRNELLAAPQRSWLRIVQSVLAEPMFLLLLLAAGLYLLLGDLAEGLVLSAFALLTIGMVILQERRSEHAIDALKALSTAYALVIREGLTQRIVSAEVVPGDLFILEEGERIAADGVLLSCQELSADESLLTGESMPVNKQASASEIPTEITTAPGGGDQSLVYSGSLVTRGKGLAKAIATGKNTQIGSIGASLASIELAPTRLQINTGKMVRLFGINAAILSVFLIIFYGVVRGEWLQGILSGITLSMTLLPQEFPLALTIFFALGAWRLAKINVLARRTAVIETLGATTVLCVDKTGTLTENKMRVCHLHVNETDLLSTGTETQLAENLHPLLEYANLATRDRSFDPMDLAIRKLATATLINTEHLHEQWPLHREYGLSPQLLAMSHVWRSNTDTYEVASKGAPEAIADLCHYSPEQTEKLMLQVSQLATNGMRVLAVAAGRHLGSILPANQHDFDFEFLGLIGFEDPLRVSVPQAVAEARSAGIKVKMLTGDFPATARAIAAQAGIGLNAAVLTGTEVAAMDDKMLQDAVEQTDVYARIMPEQKLRLVQALKLSGEVVAMTGDGVNDAPALKAAHIGIAMGQSGTDVAREAAAIVLLEEDFGKIVAAVRLGRRIFDNLRKVMLYIVAVHVPIAGLALIPVLMGWPIMLMPVHVVMIEMIINPMCAFAFENEPEEKDIMKLPPRPINEGLIGLPQLILGLVQGGVLLLTCLLVYRWVLLSGQSTDLARTLTFLTLTAGNLMMIRIIASRKISFVNLFSAQHRAYWLITAASVTLVTIFIAIPWLRGAFYFAVPTLQATVIAIVIGLLAGAALDLAKWHPWVYRTLGGSAQLKKADR